MQRYTHQFGCRMGDYFVIIGGWVNIEAHGKRWSTGTSNCNASTAEGSYDEGVQAKMCYYIL